MEKYEPNSHKYKEEQKQLPTPKKMEKVVQGNVTTKKKNELGKLADVFIASDARSVKNYILMDVLIPLVKDAIEDMITNGVRMLLRGESGARKSNTSASKVSYRSYWDRRDEDRFRNEASTQTRTATNSYEDIVFDTRGEAEDVRSRLDEAIDTYGMVSVADMYDLAGISCDRTYYNYGWTNIRNAEIIKIRQGYLLKMPKVLPIKSIQ
jgi:hypothetical protein